MHTQWQSPGSAGTDMPLFSLGCISMRSFLLTGNLCSRLRMKYKVFWESVMGMVGWGLSVSFFFLMVTKRFGPFLKDKENVLPLPYFLKLVLVYCSGGFCNCKLGLTAPQSQSSLWGCVVGLQWRSDVFETPVVRFTNDLPFACSSKVRHGW